MRPLAWWRNHIPAFIAVCALLFTLRLVSLQVWGNVHPLFLTTWVVIDLVLVAWAVWDESTKSDRRGSDE